MKNSRILESTGKADAMAVLNVKRELFELDINHRMETAKTSRMLEPAYENMVNSLRVGQEVPHQKPSRRHSGIGERHGA